MTDEIKVSVICLAYNQEGYIRDALEGFVSQKTNFKFEVLIHDDASTDATADIIREYEAKYPNLIRAVYQTENQFSQGIAFCEKYLYPMMRGTYMAWCEGDDFWCDPYKLQKQYDYLESHPECNICVSRAVFADHDTGRCTIRPKQAMSRMYTTEEVIMLGGLFFATATFMMRRDIYEAMPECFDTKYFGDWQIVIYGSMGGGCYCLQDATAVYNNKRSGSHTERTWKDTEFRDTINKEALHMFERVNAYYGYKYDVAIQNRIRHYQYRILKNQGKLDQIQGEEYAEYRVLDMMKQRMKKLK